MADGSVIINAISRKTGNRGFDHGYRQATFDLLASLVFRSEEFLRQQPGDTRELRKHLYTFVDRLEHQLIDGLEQRGIVEGGVGI